MGRLEYLMDCPDCGYNRFQEEDSGDWICQCKGSPTFGSEKARITIKTWGELVRRVNKLEKKVEDLGQWKDRHYEMIQGLEQNTGKHLKEHEKKLNLLNDRITHNIQHVNERFNKIEQYIRLAQLSDKTDSEPEPAPEARRRTFDKHVCDFALGRLQMLRHDFEPSSAYHQALGIAIDLFEQLKKEQSNG